MTYIGLDIGGTKIYAARYAKNFKKQADSFFPTEAKVGAKTVYQNVLRAIKDIMTDDVQAVGISWAGFIDSQKGIVKHAPNIDGFEDFPLTWKLKSDLGVPVFLENDARLFAYAESQLARKVSPVLLGIIIGTGVGGGLILDKNIYRGANGFAAEIGHMMTSSEQEIEHLIAGPGLKEYWHEKVGDLSLEAIREKIKTDRLTMLPIFHQRIEAFGKWLAGLVLAYDPGDIVIGGTIGRKFWSLWADEIVAAAKTFSRDYPIDMTLRFSKIETPGALGAAFFAREQLKK